MTRVRVRISPKFRQKLHKAFEKTCVELGDKMTEIIEAPGFYSPPFPSGRDIVDTGELRDSQEIAFPSPVTAQIRYPTHYALYVHEGYTLRNGRRQPARPWTTDAVEEYDLAQGFVRQLEL